MKKNKKAYFGGGCFWCIEAVYKRLKGVVSATSGYSGGEVENPSYEQVCSGKTGHVEMVEVTYDPKLISYNKLLSVFFSVHDPTTPNRQGTDVGEQYRSVIFYTDEEQKEKAQDFIEKLGDEGVFVNPIVTTVEPLEKFYEAEDYHQEYFEKNPKQAYCQLIISPKIDKLKEKYKDLVKVG
jgi:peptide-methionine (S)-S-oxide reductase